MSVAVLQPQTHWVCPNCTLEQVTVETRPHTRYHACPGLYGMTAPMIEVGKKVKVYAVERQDYVGKEIVTLDARGRPIMAVVTERENGTDALVFAPLATGSVKEM